MSSWKKGSIPSTPSSSQPRKILLTTSTFSCDIATPAAPRLRGRPPPCERRRTTQPDRLGSPRPARTRPLCRFHCSHLLHSRYRESAPGRQGHVSPRWTASSRETQPTSPPPTPV